MQRVIVPNGRCYSEEIVDGVFWERFYPGGKDGPNGEVLFETPGGQTWTDYVLLGNPNDEFQLMWPDVRLAANQLWPLHWHDTWTFVLIVEGICCIGDWWMQPGDIFITRPSLEYGPLVAGPRGCRLFEIFAEAHLAPGGYSTEFRDHPTLQGTQGKVFMERSALNRRNDGRSTLPCDGIEGAFKSRLSPGAHWDLGENGDPKRGILKDTRLMPGEKIAACLYDDWHLIAVMGGSLKVAGRTLQKDDFLRLSPHSPVPAIEAGANGAQLLEVARTSVGLARNNLA